jgi:PAS domain S-box-containing protein
MGRPIGEVLPEDVSSKAMTTLKAAFRSKKTEVFEYQLPIQEMLHHFEGRIVAISEEEALCIIREITEQKRSEEFVNIQRDFATGLSICSDMSEALNLVLDTVLKLERVDCGGIYLLDEKGTGLSLAAHKGLSEGFIREKSYYEKDTLQMGVVMKGSPVFGPYSRFVGEAVPENDDNLLGLAVIPIQHEGRVIGCFNIGSKKSKTFYEQIQTQIEALVLQAGGAISRILAEKALLRTQENFSRFFNTLDDFMFILDAQGMIMMVNPVVEKVLGYTQEELYKMHVLEVHPPDRREEAGFIVGEMLAERASYCPVPLIAKDGRQIPVETRVIKGIWDEKEVLFGISRDVTERQRAQKELELRESYLSAVIRNHPGMFWMKDVEGRFLLVNDRNDQFLKAARLAKIDSVIGKTDFDFMPAEEANHYLLEDRQVIESRSPLVVEECAPFENKNLWYEKFKFPVVDKNGTVIGVSAYSVDITNRKKLEQSLLEGIERERELNDLKTKFISVASHEFRTPLATILASSESLSSYWDRMTEEQRSQRLAKIKDQVGHMNRIIEEVLDLSKMQAKDRALEPELFDIIGLCRELTEEFMNLPGRIPVIRFQSSLEKLEVFLDKKRVMTVITNLLSNAVKYTGAGKLVEVKISKKKDHLLLEVADQGIGIPAEEIKHLFEPFFRASNTGDFSGTGLGLNIVKELVIRHSGQITVESKINEGSLFTVTLPVGAKSVKKKK